MTKVRILERKQWLCNFVNILSRTGGLVAVQFDFTSYYILIHFDRYFLHLGCHRTISYILICVVVTKDISNNYSKLNIYYEYGKNP